MSLAYDMALQNVEEFLKRTVDRAKVPVDYVRGAVPGSARRKIPAPRKDTVCPQPATPKICTDAQKLYKCYVQNQRRS